jgi:GntR family transcriptional regulator
MSTTAVSGVTAVRKHTAVRRELERLLGGMSPGEALPAERDLSRDLQVARMTLRRAVDTLVEDGRLVRRPGAGTFVAPRRVDQRLSATSFSDDMRARGMVPGGRTLWAKRSAVGTLMASVLEVDKGSAMLHVRRLRTADGAPMAVENLHVPSDLVPGLTGEDLEGASFYALLAERFRLTIASGVQTVEPCLTTPEDAACLEVDAGNPAFLFERTSRLSDGRVVEYVRSVYRGDLYRIVVDIFPTRQSTAPPT